MGNWWKRQWDEVSKRMKQTLYTCDGCGKQEPNDKLDTWWLGNTVEGSGQFSLNVLPRYTKNDTYTYSAHLCSKACADVWAAKQTEKIVAEGVTNRLTGTTNTTGLAGVLGGALGGALGTAMSPQEMYKRLAEMVNKDKAIDKAIEDLRFSGKVEKAKP